MKKSMILAAMTLSLGMTAQAMRPTDDLDDLISKFETTLSLDNTETITSDMKTQLSTLITNFWYNTIYNRCVTISDQE